MRVFSSEEGWGSGQIPLEVLLKQAGIINCRVPSTGFAGSVAVEALAWTGAVEHGMSAFTVHYLVFLGEVADLTTVSTAFEVFLSSALVNIVGELVASSALFEGT